MEYSVSAKVELSDAEAGSLAKLLNSTDSRLSRDLIPYINAAAKEYLQMFLGNQVHTSGLQIKEYRLFLLIESLGDLPSESFISSLFQCSASQSRSLLRNVMAKFRHQLSSKLNNGLKAAMRSVQRDVNQKLVVRIRHSLFVDELNILLEAMTEPQDKIVKMEGKLDMYTMEWDAYSALWDNIQPGGTKLRMRS